MVCIPCLHSVCGGPKPPSFIQHSKNLSDSSIRDTPNNGCKFNGNAEEAFTFYQSVFGGGFASIVRFKDLPAGGHPSPNGNDVPEAMGKMAEREIRSKIPISAESREEADAIFNPHPGYKLVGPGRVVANQIAGRLSCGRPWCLNSGFTANAR